jgi:drug/metabolite transporter (DMT)-like permease
VPTYVLALVVVAALAHAAWNVLAKTATGGAVFVWLFSATAVVLWAPVAAVAVAVAPGSFGLEGLGFVVGSGALHALYFTLLQRGYREGDLSLVYPLARGTGPLLSTLAAILLFGERPSALALAGGAIIVFAVLSLAGAGMGGRVGSRHEARRRAIAFAVGTGVAIAAYTLWDKRAVGPLGISPIVYYWGANLAETAILSAFIAHRRAEVARVWQAHRTQALGVAVLSPLAYILVLFALAHAPVSYVAPARELSILVGAVAGTTVLAEGDRRRRLLAAGAIFVGIVALAIG